MQKHSFAFAAAAALAAAACSSTSASPNDSADGTRLGTAEERIIGGTASTSDQDSIVLIYHLDRSVGLAACTGTLIAPNLVLTARHCVSSVVEQPFACDQNGNAQGTGANVGADLTLAGFGIFTGIDRPEFTGVAPTPTAKVSKIFHDESKILCNHDLSLLLLDRDIPSAQILPIRVDGMPQAGESITAVGWGVTTTSQFPAKRQQRTGVKIRKVGPSAGGLVDAPLSPNDFEVGEAICSGDSGGPAISESTHSIIGVVSRGGNGTVDQNDPSASCTGTNATNIYTSVAPFKDLIMSAFDASGHEPWIEGQPDPRLAKFNEDCDSNDACRSNLCVANKCTVACSAASDCSDGFVCRSVESAQVCATPAPPPVTTTTTKTGCSIAAVGGSTGNAANGPGGLAMVGALAVAASIAGRRRRRP